MRLLRKRDEYKEQLLEDAHILRERAKSSEDQARNLMAAAGELRERANACEEQAGA